MALTYRLVPGEEGEPGAAEIGSGDQGLGLEHDGAGPKRNDLPQEWMSLDVKCQEWYQIGTKKFVLYIQIRLLWLFQ